MRIALAFLIVAVSWILMFMYFPPSMPMLGLGIIFIIRQLLKNRKE